MAKKRTTGPGPGMTKEENGILCCHLHIQEHSWTSYYIVIAFKVLPDPPKREVKIR